ncbi:hypothetical protein [uncultured Dietzia sp.]|uniref:hypothetical protein n=1 Tax=uncultured Dietzia sp. TaxID=395519 RepID=UPI0025CDCDB9|nr:hypothetical protein [uncultured Dietzia sp.]
MVLFWFLLALVLLVAALIILRLDAKQRRGRADAQRPAVEQDRSRSSGEGAGGAGGDAVENDRDDDDNAEHSAPFTGEGDAADGPAGEPGEPRLAPFQRVADAGPVAGAAADPVADAADEALAPTSADAASSADADAAADDEALAAASVAVPAPLDPTEPTVESSPRLLDRVRALLPTRRATRRSPEPFEPEPVDPLAGSPVVRWLEDREFAPTPTPAPEFRHGDFAGGLSALGTVSHGVFRGRRAIMGVTGGRTVLALRRDTASDVVLDLSRPDVDSEPGFHDAGDAGGFEARTTDYGRLDLIDRDRLIESVRDVPPSVRRVWAEGEWVAATIDGVDDPAGWDDVVMALHAAADVLAPFPPIGGRARALPAELDPGAPASAEGPDADPTVGMDGEVGTGTHGIAPLPDPEDHVVVDDPSDSTASPIPAGTTPSDAPTSTMPVAAAAGPRRAGHLRLVPDRPAARDLSDVPVVADRGDAAEDAGPAGTAELVDETDAAADVEPAVEESDPFDEIMKPSAPVEARGDVAADHLEPRPPLSRPTRGIGQAYPEDATVPPLAAGAATGGAGIKPLGSEDDEDEIRDEVERFDAARIDGRSDLDEPSTGRHGEADQESGGRHGADDVDPSEVTQRLSVAELAARMGIDPSEMKTSGRRRRRAEAAGEGDEEVSAGSDADTDSDESSPADSDEPARGRERPGIEPDVEKTARLELPPDIKD